VEFLEVPLLSTGAHIRMHLKSVQNYKKKSIYANVKTQKSVETVLLGKIRQFFYIQWVFLLSRKGKNCFSSCVFEKKAVPLRP
jgi:hypothetical protein